MKNKTIIIAVVAIIIIGAIMIWSKKSGPTPSVSENENKQTEGTKNNPNGSVRGGTTSNTSNPEVELAIKTKILAFGQKLKNVSIVAADFQSKIDLEYKDYIAPELLVQWKADKTLVLGTAGSNPWPDRLEIVKITKQTNTKYTVDATVIEVGVDSPKTVGVYPVTLTVENRIGNWMITKVEKGTYMKAPEAITVSGLWECLPHKTTTGPQTMECAYGIKADTTGKHYAVSLTSTVPAGTSDTIPMNTHIKVTGTLVPINTLNSDMWQKYNIEGIVAVSELKRI